MGAILSSSSSAGASAKASGSQQGLQRSTWHNLPSPTHRYRPGLRWAMKLLLTAARLFVLEHKPAPHSMMFHVCGPSGAPAAQ